MTRIICIITLFAISGGIFFLKQESRSPLISADVHQIGMDSLALDIYSYRVATLHYSKGVMRITGYSPCFEKIISDKMVIDKFLGYVDSFLITKSERIYFRKTKSKRVIVTDYPVLNFRIHLSESRVLTESVTVGEEGYDIEYNPKFLEFYQLLESLSNDAIPYQSVDEKPRFEGGGIDNFKIWVDGHKNYPVTAKKDGCQGRVLLQFKIGFDGKIGDVYVLKGINPELDNEAVRVVSTSPDWSPGRQAGIPITVIVTFPVDFVP